MIVIMSKDGRNRFLFRSQGIRFESLMEERRMLLERGCQNKSHGLGIGTVICKKKIMGKNIKLKTYSSIRNSKFISQESCN